MKIAVNARFLIKDRIEGMGRFTYETLKRISAAHPEHEFILFFDRDHHNAFTFGSNVTCVTLFPPARHPFLFVWFFEFSVYRALKKYQPDVFLSCDGFLSLRSAVPQIPVIHDLAFEHYPKDVGLLMRIYYRFFFPRFARKATHIATVSEFSKSDIQNYYGIGESKISVVYNGASSLFQPATHEVQDATRNEYTGGAPYFVYAGALQPRKNIVRLLQAFDRFKEDDTQQVKLLIVGRMAWQTQDIETCYNNMKYKDAVLFTGRISDEALARVYASALALTYVPYLEGFGIPILEAMQCGTPVITSEVTAMPEVAGKAGLLIDPLSTDSIAQAMSRMANDGNLRKELSALSLVQSKKFSWENTAASVWKILEATGKK